VDGRFSYGKMAEGSGKTTFSREKGLKTESLPREWKRSKGNRAGLLLDTYQARGGKGLRHGGLVGVAVSRNSMAHSMSPSVSGAKAAVLMSPKLMQSLFGAGHARQEPVRKKKKGKIDKNKVGWLECWHVTGNARIDGVMRRYDFTVAKKAGGFELYDLKMN
jgi:hypothetical protein